MSSKPIEYAIVDIETTGGNARHSRITEIAIYIHNGIEVIDHWETLVHPQKDIPPAIWALTGINNDLVADAPIFEDIAAQVFSYLNGRVFVAHNVNFDYSFIKHELAMAGIQWSAKKLCTVRLSRKLFPGKISYSLGRLCDALNIPIENRHRAGGDAAATSILFTQLLQAEGASDVLLHMMKKSAPEQRLPPNLPPEQFNDLSTETGVYYFHDQQGKIIYVGKAINIKKRVATHFTGHNINAQRQNFLKDIYSISYEVCGTELMALLLECMEIKKYWPKYNRALKKFEPQYGLFQYEAMNGYLYLSIGKISKHHQPIQFFNTSYEAIQVLKQIAHEHDIDMRLCRFGFNQSTATVDSPQDLPERNFHNSKIEQAIEIHLSQRPSYLIKDKGRTKEEQSCIWVANGQLKAMGYIDAYAQLEDMEDLLNQLKPCVSNHYVMQLIQQFVERFPNKKHNLAADYSCKNQMVASSTVNYKRQQALLF